jgi:hypothetical protein
VPRRNINGYSIKTSAGEQINPGQQVERAIAFVLMIRREGRVHAGLGRQIQRPISAKEFQVEKVTNDVMMMWYGMRF